MPTKMLCLRTDMPAAIPSIRRHCSSCHSEVWITEASLNAAEENNADLVCEVCLTGDPPEEYDFRPLTEEQRRELINATAN